MLKIYFIILTALFSLVVSAQQVVEIPVQFSSLNLKGPLRVELIPSDECRAVVSLYGVEPSRLSWHSKGSLLSIIMRVGLMDKNCYAEVKIYYTALSSILSEGATITNDNVLEGESLAISTQGSVNKIQLNIVVQQLDIKASGKSDIAIIGSAKWADLRAIMGSRIDCMQMEIADVIASSNQGSEIYVKVSDRLDANVSTAGNIYYMGKPRLKVKSTLGGGVIAIEPPKSTRREEVVIEEETTQEVTTTVTTTVEEVEIIEE